MANDDQGPKDKAGQITLIPPEKAVVIELPFGFGTVTVEDHFEIQATWNYCNSMICYTT